MSGCIGPLITEKGAFLSAYNSSMLTVMRLLYLNINSKSYMGSPKAPINLIVSSTKRSCSELPVKQPR